MITLVDIEKCTGCLSCYNSCNNNSIILKKDSRGFIFPAIDGSKCVSCGKCVASCPLLKETPGYPILECYYGQSKQTSILNKSATGGISTEINLDFFNRGAAVFGAGFDENFNVNHYVAASIEDIFNFSGSKYVQSDVGLTYRKIASLLQNGRTVLFNGTPCQVAGLKSFLKKDYPSLLTVDFLCHSAPSPKAFELYKNYLTKKVGAIDSITFKCKKNGYSFPLLKVSGSKKTKYFTSQNDRFMHAFLSGKISRESCDNCVFRNCHVSDITLADCYDYLDNNGGKLRFKNGVNRIICWSKKGDEAIKGLDNVVLEASDKSKILKKYDLRNHVSKSRIDFSSLVEGDEEAYFKKNFKVPLKKRILSFLRNALFKLGLQDAVKKFRRKDV